MKGEISFNPMLVRMPFDKFKAWHKRTLPDDTKTAEDRYRELGGKVPVRVDKPKDK